MLGNEVAVGLARSAQVPGSSRLSAVAEEKINNPTFADVNDLNAAVSENCFVFASGVLKCISEDGHGAEIARIIHLPRP
jgi:hypothetical protein